MDERTVNSDSPIQLSPISFIRGGYYYYIYGGIDQRKSEGAYWSSISNQDKYTIELAFHLNYLGPYNAAKGDGFSLRCLVR